MQGIDGFLELLLGGPINPTQKRFIYEGGRFKGYMGQAGAAKTSTLCAAGLLRAFMIPGSKGFIGRHDYNDLLGTTLQRAETMIGRLPKGTLVDRDKSPPYRMWVKPLLADEAGEPAEIMCMGLKEALGSYELTWAAVDEADEVDEIRIQELNGRMRGKGTSEDYMVALAFNPPAKTHWLYTACTGKDHQEQTAIDKKPYIKLYRPIPGENIRNLPADYYEQMASMPDELRMRLRDGEWGSVFPGTPVYKAFKHGTHVRNLDYDPNLPLFRFWDFGYNRPACIWAQVDLDGRLLHLKEKLGFQVEATEWAKHCTGLTNMWFPGKPFVTDFGDPAVKQKKDTGSTLKKFLDAGIKMRFKEGGPGSIDRGVNLIRRRLNTLIAGEPAMQFSRTGCPVLIDSLKGGYRLDKLGADPVKDGFYDHLADAERYGVDNLFGSGDISTNRDVGHAQIPDSLEYDPSHDPN